MERISIEDLEKMTQTKYVCTLKIKLSDEIFGDTEKHILEFDIFDGFAYCPNHNGKEYFMNYPKKKFVEDSTTMSKEVRDFMELDEHEPITEKASLASYYKLKVNA